MKLLYTTNSPYARIARVCALEHAIDVEMLLVGVRESADVILKYNPAGKVPSLVLDDDRVLSDSRLICEHFDWLVDGSFTARVTEASRRCEECLVSGFLDGVAVWVREARRPQSEQSPDILRLESERARRCLAHFERSWDTGSVQPGYAAVALVSGIELVDTRLQTEWRKNCQKLAEWFEKISENSHLRATKPLPP